MKDSIDDWVESFKAIQTKINSIELYLVKNEKYTNISLIQYVNALKKHTFGEINFNIRLVPQIPRDNSGKNRVFVSRI